MKDYQGPRVLALPGGTVLKQIVSPRAVEVLEELGEVEWNRTGRNLTREEVLERIPGCAAVLTTWEAPIFDEELLDAAPNLRIIGHAAGSIKNFIPRTVFERGIAVTHGAIVLADSVAEWTLTMILMALRKVHVVDRALQADDPWPDYRSWAPRELFHKRVGIIGASMVGRKVIELLEPFMTDVVIYDPYLTDQHAAELGARKLDLDELMSTSDVITNHAPTTDETDGMVEASHWRSMKSGAVFVNTARAASVDYDALLKVLQTGRITAALDVFPLPEPLAEDSPFRVLPNVILSPHVAGFSVESRLRLGETIAEEFVRFFAGQPLRYGVTADMLKTMA